MKVALKFIERQVACCLAILLSLPCAEAFAAPPQQAPPSQQSQNAGPAESSSLSSANANADLTLAKSDLPDAPAPASSQSNDQNGQSGSAQSSTDQQQNGPVKPLGTAAAPYEKAEGVAASRPAGAVIAPAKQRRVRAIFISIGVVVGAGVAIGTVAALSHSSPSRP